MSTDPISLGSALGVTNQLGSSVTVVKSGNKSKDPVTKNEGKLLRSNALTVDDNQTTAFDYLGKGKVVKPTYDPVLLSILTQQNNTLLQCSAAMEVNIDGTGYDIERLDGEALTDGDKEKVAQIKQFFDESYPGESFVTQRRAMRRDLESTGCGYLEVIRDQAGQITFTRRLDAKLMRLVALDAPVTVTKTVKRMGVDKTVVMQVRERRFCMQVGSTFRFFREFGASRNVDLLSGEWLDTTGAPVPGSSPLPYNAPTPTPKGNVLATPGSGNALAVATGAGPAPGPAKAPEARPKATEVIFFTTIPDVGTGYGVPRWINQMPSVLGSRKAEEFNLEFFNAGGLPPALILVQGGQLSPDSKVALTNYLGGKAKFKQRGVIAEIFAAGGSLDGAGGSVKVTVERFGDERQKDSMFGNYDTRCADHVRGAFRLPPLFLGNSADHNFATAYASYMVAEAQVFRPEREEFDEIINVKIMREIAPDYLFRSLPLQINDVTNQLKALEMSKDIADKEEWIKTLNEVSSLTLTVSKEDPLDANALTKLTQQMMGRAPVGADDGTETLGVEADGKGRVAKMDNSILTELATDYANHLSGAVEFNKASVDTMEALIKTLAPGVRQLFNAHVATNMVNPVHDAAGTAGLIAAASACLSS